MSNKQADIDRGYRIGNWGGAPNYECIRCPFKITSLDHMIDHVNEHVAREEYKLQTGMLWEDTHEEYEFATQPQAEEAAPTVDELLEANKPSKQSAKTGESE